MIWPSKWRHLKGLSDLIALASCRRDDPRPYPTKPLFATEPSADPLLQGYGMKGRGIGGQGVRFPLGKVSRTAKKKSSFGNGAKRRLPKELANRRGAKLPYSSSYAAGTESLVSSATRNTVGKSGMKTMRQASSPVW